MLISIRAGDVMTIPFHMKTAIRSLIETICRFCVLTYLAVLTTDEQPSDLSAIRHTNKGGSDWKGKLDLPVLVIVEVKETLQGTSVCENERQG